MQSGLAVMFALLDEDVTAVCGPCGKHNPERTAATGSAWTRSAPG
ncbi:hypothetical protein [Planobispora takensis]